MSAVPTTPPAAPAPEAKTAAPSLPARPKEESVTPPRVDFRGVTVRYRTPDGPGVEAVRDMTFEIPDVVGRGEIIVFLGPSGCGKSTILKAIAGLVFPESGSVTVRGRPVTGPGRDRGMVFQAYTSFAWRTVLGNVEYGLELQGVKKPERRREALKFVEAVGLKDFANAYPRQLSGGMKQRVAIARTLINKPDVVLMDEPFGALDPQTRWGMQGMLLDVVRSQQNTVVFVTHDVAEAVYLADTVYVLSARPAQLIHRADVPFFRERDIKVKSSAEFRRLEAELLETLHSGGVSGNIRVGL